MLESSDHIDYGFIDMTNHELPLHLRMLGVEFARRKSKNPKYSLRAFSRSLKIAPTPLSEILSGKRDISLKIADRIVTAMKLEHSAKHQFLRSVAESKRNRGVIRMDHRLKKILDNDSSSYQERKPLEPADFSIISEWYYLAIVEMTRLDEFKLDADWIAGRLNITPSQAKEAIERLMRLELISTVQGRTIASAPHYETTDKKKTSEAHRAHQRQLLEKSIRSIEEIPLERRIHSAICFAINPERISEARMICEEFLDRMSDLLENDPSKTELYQFQLSLFPLTNLTHK